MSKDKNLSKDVLSAVNKKTGKNISETEVKKLASSVTNETMQSEAELTKLIKQVSAMAKVPVSDKTINDIVKAVKASGMNMNNMESIMKMMIKK
ncbi:stage VI sporulation protein F [Paenibacillus kobensis]|uniref:stage VI sporulation protein F n=1 Tax=Paenibacillus kobensis TaxID=59841 RepID=UPI000FD6C09E|nr:stage VI sporulation protein F [Paenibacillus kobensis]